MEVHLRKMRDWFAEKADTAQARVWLMVLSFTESSVFVIPPDPLLAAMAFVHKDRWFQYALITTAASVAGALFGYVLGALFFDFVGAHIVELYHLQPHMAKATELVHDGVFVFTVVMAFTPIPFKVAVLAAGFTKANLLAFLIATVGGRGVRYAIVALVARVFGEHAEHIMKRFWWYTALGGVVALALYSMYYFFL